MRLYCRFGTDQDARSTVGVAGNEGVGTCSPRLPAVPACDAGKFPSADQFVLPEGNIVKERLALAKRQLVGGVRANNALLLEVGVSAALPGPYHVAHQADAADARIARGVGEGRNIIDRVLPGVVEVEVQTVRHVLRQGEQHGVVAGKSLIAIERVFRELRRGS